MRPRPPLVRARAGNQMLIARFGFVFILNIKSINTELKSAPWSDFQDKYQKDTK